MLFYNCHLNEDVLFFVENLKFLERKYLKSFESMKITDETLNIKILSEIQQVIKECTNIKKSADTYEYTLRNIFKFMLTKYSGLNSIVPCPTLNLSSIIYLAIINHVIDYTQVIKYLK